MTRRRFDESKRTFFSFQRARRPTPETLTILKRTPGISPFALPRRPKPEIRTSSFSSTKFKQPSFCRYKSIFERDFIARDTHGDEGGDLLSVLDELHTHTLANSRVGLLGLDTDFLEHDALGVRRTTSGRGLVDVTEGALLVRLVRLFPQYNQPYVLLRAQA